MRKVCQPNKKVRERGIFLRTCAVLYAIHKQFELRASTVNIDQKIIRNGQRRQHPRKFSQAALLLPSTTHIILDFRWEPSVFHWKSREFVVIYRHIAYFSASGAESIVHNWQSCQSKSSQNGPRRAERANKVCVKCLTCCHSFGVFITYI